MSTPNSLLYSSQSSRVQDIVQEDLGLRDGELGVWSRRDGEGNDVNHLVIHRSQEGNWVTFQPYTSNRSIHLFYSNNDITPP